MGSANSVDTRQKEGTSDGVSCQPSQNTKPNGISSSEHQPPPRPKFISTVCRSDFDIASPMPSPASMMSGSQSGTPRHSRRPRRCSTPPSTTGVTTCTSQRSLMQPPSPYGGSGNRSVPQGTGELPSPLVKYCDKPAPYNSGGGGGGAAATPGGGAKGSGSVSPLIHPDAPAPNTPHNGGRHQPLETLLSWSLKSPPQIVSPTNADQQEERGAICSERGRRNTRTSDGPHQDDKTADEINSNTLYENLQTENRLPLPPAIIAQLIPNAIEDAAFVQSYSESTTFNNSLMTPSAKRKISSGSALPPAALQEKEEPLVIEIPNDEHL